MSRRTYHSPRSELCRNRRFSYSEPLKYLAKYKVPDDRVSQQPFPNRALWCSDRFEEFVKKRSDLLSDAMNDNIQRLDSGELQV
jgi:hypothetical protein